MQASALRSSSLVNTTASADGDNDSSTPDRSRRRSSVLSNSATSDGSSLRNSVQNASLRVSFIDIPDPPAYVVGVGSAEGGNTTLSLASGQNNDDDVSLNSRGSRVSFVLGDIPEASNDTERLNSSQANFVPDQSDSTLVAGNLNLRRHSDGDQSRDVGNNRDGQQRPTSILRRSSTSGMQTERVRNNSVTIHTAIPETGILQSTRTFSTVGSAEATNGVIPPTRPAPQRGLQRQRPMPQRGMSRRNTTMHRSMAHIFDADGHALTTTETRDMWRQRGKCMECGNVTVRKVVRWGPVGIFHKYESLTVPGVVYKGYCLDCHTLSEARRLAGESNVPDDDGDEEDHPLGRRGVWGGGNGGAAVGEESALPESAQVQLEAKKKRAKRVVRLQICAIITILLVGAVVGVVVGVTQSGGDSGGGGGDNSSDGNDQATNDVGSGTTFATTEAPTLAPSSSPTTSPTYLGWDQIGNPIKHETAGSTFGRALSLSSYNLNQDSKTRLRVAIGTPIANDMTGLVQVYQLVVESNEDENWVELGQPLTGSEPSEETGAVVSLNDDGDRLAVGSPGIGSGFVTIYQLGDDNEWTMLGDPIFGESDGDQFGRAISLSGDGSTVATGAVGNAGSSNMTWTGSVRVHRYDDTSGKWMQLGPDIDGGDAPFDQFGKSVSLSRTGSTVAVGIPSHDEYGEDSGNVRVYEYNEGTKAWDQFWQDIRGEKEGDRSGRSVALSASGRHVIIGAHQNDKGGNDAGHVRVYWHTTQQDVGWYQVGFDIDGDHAGDGNGFSVDISDDGRRIAVGSRMIDGKVGTTKIYHTYDDWTWTQLGEKIDGGEGVDGFSLGQPVSLSGDGKFVAIGAEHAAESDEESGRVRVFTWRGI